NAVDIPGWNLFFVRILLLAPATVRAAPEVDDPEWSLVDAEVLVEPVASARSGSDETTGPVFQDLYLVALTSFPRSLPIGYGPVERVAFAFQAHENRTGLVVVRF